MKKAFAVVWAALFLAGSAWGAGKEITYNLGADPRTIDPALNTTLDGSQVIGSIFEGLVRLGDGNQPEPACAESWGPSSEDGLSWTFRLREGLRWSDGKPLTAEDFRYGFLRLVDPETASPYAHYGFFIKNGEAFYDGKAKAEEVGLAALDDRTLRLDLEYPFPMLLEYLSFHSFMPARRDRVEAEPRGWAAKPETLISNGPFTLKAWRHGEGGEITLSKNPYYWGAEGVKADGIRMVMISDSSTALAAFRAGRIDYLTSPPSRMIPQLLKSGEARSLPSMGISFCDFNTTRPPFDDARVRRAFTLAIDRKAIVEKITMGGQKPAGAFVPYTIPGATPGQDFRTEGGSFLPERADIPEARRLLAEAGYPEGKGFPQVTYKYNSNPENKAMAEALQGMWKQALGVEVTLFNEEWKVFLETRQKGDYDIARDAWVLDFFDAANVLELFVSKSPQNVTRYSNPAYDRLMNNAARETGPARRVGILHEAERLLMEDLPGAPICFSSAVVMESRRVRGIHRFPNGWVCFREAEVVE